jgi:hypothetical protein
MSNLNPRQFSRTMDYEGFQKILTEHLGPEASEDHPGHETADWDRLPSHVYRVMSDEHLEITRRTGFHQSDERNNYIGQAKESPLMAQHWAEQGKEPEREGTVAGRWAETGYASKSPTGRAVVAKIEVDPEDGWEDHPDVPGEYARTMKPIPAHRIVAVTPRFRFNRDGQYEVDL